MVELVPCLRRTRSTAQSRAMVIAGAPTPSLSAAMDLAVVLVVRVAVRESRNSHPTSSRARHTVTDFLNHGHRFRSPLDDARLGTNNNNDDAIGFI